MPARVADRLGEQPGLRGDRCRVLILGGLVSVAFGVVLFAHPGVGAITLALLFGLFNLVFGARALVQGIELRRTGNAVHSAVHDGIRPSTTSGYPHSSAATPGHVAAAGPRR